MVLQHLRHPLYPALDISIHVIRLLNVDGFADVEEIAVGVAVIVANSEQGDHWRAAIAGQPRRSARQRRLLPEEGHRNTATPLGKVTIRHQGNKLPRAERLVHPS